MGEVINSGGGSRVGLICFVLCNLELKETAYIQNSQISPNTKK